MNSSGFSMYKGMAGKTVTAVRPCGDLAGTNGATPPGAIARYSASSQTGGDFLADLSKSAGATPRAAAKR